jgi:hypothetical protein
MNCSIRSVVFTRLGSLSALAFLAFLPGAGCGASHSAEPETGQIMLALGTIPENVNCVRISAVGVGREFTRDLDVAPGQTVSEAISGLPVGVVVFSANAYATACSSVTKATVPMWVSDEKTVTLVQGKSSTVTLTLYKNGRAKVTVEFADDQDGGTSLASPDAGTGSRG